MAQNKDLIPGMEVIIEKKFDVLRKSWDSRVFTRLYQTIRTSGLLAKLPDKEFKTLICLATFVDAYGNCFPSREAVAQGLGISPAAVTERINSLLAFRWQGKPLVSAKKIKGWKGMFETTVYSILPDYSLRILGES
jgi:hypothetical protein